jgi:hypothetical protein
VLAEVDVARLHQLQQLRLLPKLRAGILVDQHGALAQFLELVGKQVAGDGVAGVAWLIVGKAITLCFLRACTRGEHDSRGRNRSEHRFPWIPHDALPPLV